MRDDAGRYLGPRSVIEGKDLDMRDWNSIHYALEEMNKELSDCREALLWSTSRRYILARELAEAHLKIKELLHER